MEIAPLLNSVSKKLDIGALRRVTLLSDKWRGKTTEARKGASEWFIIFAFNNVFSVIRYAMVRPGTIGIYCGLLSVTLDSF